MLFAGPVAAAYKAVDAVLGLDPVPELLEYTVNSLTEGIEALVTTRVVIKPVAPAGEEGENQTGAAAGMAAAAAAAPRPELTAAPARSSFSGGEGKCDE